MRFDQPLRRAEFGGSYMSFGGCAHVVCAPLEPCRFGFLVSLQFAKGSQLFTIGSGDLWGWHFMW